MLTLKIQGLDALITHLQTIVNSDPSTAAKQP
jgi:hypothetical protein